MTPVVTECEFAPKINGIDQRFWPQSFDNLVKWLAINRVLVPVGKK